MTNLVDGTIRMRALAAIFLFAASAFAQVGGAPGAMVNQLSLSGRTVQNGSVTATQSPVPGTTTSVNTINPTLQVSGSFAGSTGSTARSEEHTSELQSLRHLVCRLLLEK